MRWPARRGSALGRKTEVSQPNRSLDGARACGLIVGRYDPHLHATALFAPEPARSRLMVLYAFDVELSRAALPSTEPLIPRIRLQWWRDVAETARGGAPPPAHEVAGPFARLAARDLPTVPVEELIEAREAELAGGFDEARFTAWTDARFGALTALAAGLLTGGNAGAAAFARRAGLVLGTAFALRNAPAMAAEHRVLLPGLPPADWTALADGDLTEATRERIRRLAAAALARLRALRADRRSIDRRATPALLPLVRAGRVLRRAEQLGDPLRRPAPTAPCREERAQRSAGAPGVDNLHDIDRPFDGLRLAWAAASGRW